MFCRIGKPEWRAANAPWATTRRAVVVVFLGLTNASLGGCGTNVGDLKKPVRMVEDSHFAVDLLALDGDGVAWCMDAPEDYLGASLHRIGRVTSNAKSGVVAAFGALPAGGYTSDACAGPNRIYSTFGITFSLKRRSGKTTWLTCADQQGQLMDFRDAFDAMAAATGKSLPLTSGASAGMAGCGP